jgi:hypothetical protein
MCSRAIKTRNLWAAEMSLRVVLVQPALYIHVVGTGPLRGWVRWTVTFVAIAAVALGAAGSVSADLVEHDIFVTYIGSATTYAYGLGDSGYDQGTTDTDYGVTEFKIAWKFVGSVPVDPKNSHYYGHPKWEKAELTEGELYANPTKGCSLGPCTPLYAPCTAPVLLNKDWALHGGGLFDESETQSHTPHRVTIRTFTPADSAAIYNKLTYGFQGCAIPKTTTSLVLPYFYPPPTTPAAVKKKVARAARPVLEFTVAPKGCHLSKDFNAGYNWEETDPVQPPDTYVGKLPQSSLRITSNLTVGIYGPDVSEKECAH